MPIATSLYVRCLGLLIAFVGLLELVPQATAVEAQNPASRIAPSPAQPYEVRGSERRLLARFERLVQQAQWEDALEAADQLLALKSSAVIAINETRYVSMHNYCHGILSQLPAEVLVDYRAMVDAPAEAWYRQGVAERDGQLLQRVIDEAFCSSWGDDALNALGEMALERGDYLAARMVWKRISASLYAPDSSAGLTYPDTDLNLADLQARLVLVSLREGNLDRAELELENLFVRHGEVRGKLGGREVVYIDELEKLLKQARTWPSGKQQSDWPTYAGKSSRLNFSPTRPKTSIHQVWSHRLSEEDTEELNIFPVVTNNLVIYQGNSQVQALHLDSGKVAFSSRGEAFESAREMPENQQQPYHTLMATEHFVFGTTVKSGGQRPSQGSQAKTQLWGIDLQRDGALAIRKQRETPGEGFAGAPLVVGSQMFVTIRTSDNPAKVGVACYDRATGKLRWQQWICQTRGVASGDLRQWSSNLLTYNSGLLFCCTNTGAIAAVRARDGQLQWIRTYTRSSGQSQVGERLADFRLPNPCIYNQGLLFVVPSDSDKLLALQADTGQLQWQREMASLTSEIVGIVDGNLLVSERGMYAINANTGEVTTTIPHTNTRLVGQPAITEKLIYWPSYQKIELIELAQDTVLEQTVPWAEQGGANLVLAGDYLVAAGRTQIAAYRLESVPIQSPQVKPDP